ncbi:5-formyltetrahydrofolate cyclo-ligase [Paenibacillus sp. GCM10012307]
MNKLANRAYSGKLRAAKNEITGEYKAMNNKAALKDKQELRRRMAAIRDKLAGEERRRLSALIGAEAARWLADNNIRSMMAYVSFRSEVDTTPLIDWAWSEGIALVAPRCIPSTKEMILYQLTGWNQLQTGAYGIREPNPGLAAAWDPERMPEAVLVPGLAYDLQGGRLGYGGGYYDRFFEQAVYQTSAGGRVPYWLGLSFEAQLVADGRIPGEPHDIRLDAVFTERGAYPLKSRK